MKGKTKERRTSKRVAESPGCAPLKQAYADAVAAKPTSWKQVEASFLKAMEGFDSNVSLGVANQGDWQNGKGDFLNDVLALILENCASVTLVSRTDVPGLIVPNHNLDVTFPALGVVQFLVEVKAVGNPKHPGNPKQKNPLGRPGSSDLPKRIKEGAFKTIDLKAEYGRIQTQLGKPATSAPGGNLTTWLRQNKPMSYLFISARVVDKPDSLATLALARLAANVFDGVGLCMFRPLSADVPPTYERVDVPADVELDRVLYRACQDILSIQGPEEAPITPAEEAGTLLAAVAEDAQEENDEEE